MTPVTFAGKTLIIAGVYRGRLADIDNINAFKKGISQLTQQENAQISSAKNNYDR